MTVINDVTKPVPYFLINVVYCVGSYSPQPPNPERQIGPVLETALQRAPILHIHAGKLQAAVTRYRYIKSTVLMLLITMNVLFGIEVL